LEASLGKKFTRSYLNRKKLGKVAHPSYNRKYKIGGLQSRLV
jgi:hypothetical protein